MNQEISFQGENETNPFSPKKLPNFNEQGIGALAVDGSGNTYVGADDGTNGFLYKSTDGINFNKIMDTPKAYIDDILIQNEIIYVSTNGHGLYKSTDGGNSFTTIENSPKNIRFNSLVITPNDVIYIGTFIGGGVWAINLIEQFLKMCKKHKLDFNNKVKEIKEYYK